ncbi:hypothetical protein ACHAXT_009352 [Thalassiosira profunda]
MAPPRGPTFILDEEGDTTDSGVPASQFAFSQVQPDQSQFLDGCKPGEKKKFDALAATSRNRLVADLSRIMLFKALNGEAIDKPKVIAEALGEDLKKERVGNAAMEEAEKRLADVFGFRVKQVSEKMKDDLPNRFKTRYYLTNEVADDDDGSHRRALHSANAAKAAERALLMNVLAFAFCKGATQVHGGVMKGAGKKTRWITEHHLYALLHAVDENVPKEPPSAEGKKRSRQSAGSRLSLDAAAGEGAGQTPDIDVLLEQFVAMDYLLRDKIDEPEGQRGSSQSDDGKVIAYAMGPRAVLEIGRRQIIMFCSNVLDEQPDPTMMAEIEEDEEGEESEEEDEMED